MSDNRYLRMTIDVCVFPGDSNTDLTIAYLLKEGKEPFGLGERLARSFMDAIKSGHVEIDDIRNVEDHT